MVVVDAAHAAAVLAANGWDGDPAGVSDAAGYTAWLHPDAAAADRWRLAVTVPAAVTLIGWGMVEGGWLSLYDLDAWTR